MNIHVNAALLKITGVFAFESKKDFTRFTTNGYNTMYTVDLPKSYKEIEKAKADTRSYYKNTYYAEFRDLMFTGKDPKDYEGLQKKQIKAFQRSRDLEGDFVVEKDKPEIKFSSRHQELYLFPDGIGIFAMVLDVAGKTLAEISNLINKARHFNSELKAQLQLHQFISSEVLCGIPIVGEGLEVDEYSGSKFKVYAIIDVPASTKEVPYDRDALLYELGTSSMIGTIAGNGHYKPSEEYYHALLQNKVSAFANYDCLALLDSFTVVGTDNYRALSEKDDKYIPHHIWNRSYFAIYVFNLYVRYNLYKFNSKFLTHPIKYRSQFQDFINNYNFTHISFNFLPNMIFSKMRSALGIDTEIEKFEKRLTAIAANVQENQEKRQAFLLTLISVVSSFSAAKDIVQTLNHAQEWLGWSNELFYSALAVFVIATGYALFSFLFPLTAKRFKRKWEKFWENPTKNKKW